MLFALALATQLAGLDAASAGGQAAAPPFTLADAVAQARRASPVRGAAVAIAESTTEAAKVSGRPLNPAVDLRVENWVPGSNPGVTSPLLDMYAVVVQPFEIAGKRGARRDIATAEQGFASAGLRVVDRQLALDTVRFYVQALRARGQLEMLAANRNGLAALVDTMRRRVQEGFAPESDLLKFMTETARIDADIARAQLDLARSLTALTTLVGAPASIGPAQLVEPISLDPPAADSAAIETAVSRLPDVQLASARVDRARMLAVLETARRIPDPIVSAGYKRTAGQDTAVVAVTYPLPLFDRNAQAIVRATGEQNAAARELDALTRRLANDTASLLAAATALDARARRADAELLAPADGVRAAARAAFREGSADMLRLIDAERVYADVRRAALDLKLDAFLAAIEARFALGQEDVP